MPRRWRPSPPLLALLCLPACYCSHTANGDGVPDSGTVRELADAAVASIDSAHPVDLGSDAASDTAADAAVERDGGEPRSLDAGPSLDMGAVPGCANGATHPRHLCVPAAQGGALRIDRSSMLRVELPNPGPLCAPIGGAKCDVKVDWDAGVLELCTYRVISPGPHECPPTVGNECHVPPLEVERTWLVRINGEASFTIESEVDAAPDALDRCMDLRAADSSLAFEARR